MALTTLAAYKAFAGLTSTDATRDASLAQMLVQIEAGIKRLCRPYQFESTTQTDIILPAPWTSPWLLLPLVPVRSITSIYYTPSGYGVVANFTSDTLLVSPAANPTGPDYELEIDMYPEGWSRSGRVRRLGRSIWGYTTVRPFGELATRPEVESGSVKVTYVAGHTTVPADVVEAVHLATSLTYQRRKGGAPVTSSSWNGYSESLAGPFVSTSVLGSPDIQQLLAPYMTQIVVGG